MALIGGPYSEFAESLSELSGEFKLERVSVMDLVEGEIPPDLSEFDAALVDATSFPESLRDEFLAELLARLEGMHPHLRPIALVAEEHESSARIAAASGAWDVLMPSHGAAEIVKRVRSAAWLRSIEKHAAEEFRSTDSGLGPDSEETENRLLGESTIIQAVLRNIDQVGGSDVPVLLLGESGTGKELTAKSIHACGPRAKGPLVPVNCGAIPEELLESELFGHVRGAFTGATQSRPGRFEAADGGTLFLDEVGELPLALQSKLLRFLEDYTLQRIGEERLRRLDVRIIAASNRDLESEVTRGAFREDLYYRLAVFTIQLPPLRERKDDLIRLSRHFLKRYAREYRRVVFGFSRGAESALVGHDWPGNVRELMNRVRRAVIVAPGAWVTPVDLGLHHTEDDAPLCGLREARREADLGAIRTALCRNRGNKSEAARELGISRTRLYELISRYRVGGER